MFKKLIGSKADSFALQKTLVWGSIVVIAAVDFLTGVEYRVFPLYFLPLSWIAWYMGRGNAVVAAGLCSVTWVFSNTLAGLSFSRPSMWIINYITQMVSFVVVGVLIAEVRRGYERERALSRLDPLTGLLNSRAFHIEAERIISITRRYGRALTVGYIDLDDFKRVNDSLGHHAGDDILKRTAELLEGAIRAGDVLSRLGGDEFAILLPETGPEGAEILLERLRRNLFEALGEGPTSVTVSVGAVSFLTAPGGIEDLVRSADALMYRAKAMGKNRVLMEVVGGPVTVSTVGAVTPGSVSRRGR